MHMRVVRPSALRKILAFLFHGIWCESLLFVHAFKKQLKNVVRGRKKQLLTNKLVCVLSSRVKQRIDVGVDGT